MSVEIRDKAARAIGYAILKNAIHDNSIRIPDAGVLTYEKIVKAREILNGEYDYS